MSRPPEPLFLARQSYRYRRLGDAARVLPVFGLVLMFLPVLWSDGARTSSGLIFIFGTWAALIVIVALISRRLGRTTAPSGDSERDGVR